MATTLSGRNTKVILLFPLVSSIITENFASNWRNAIKLAL